MANQERRIFDLFGIAPHLRMVDAHGLRQAIDLDEAHWVATSAPLATLNCDPTFKELLDVDANQRITCRNLKQAIVWLLAVMADHRGIDARSPRLDVSLVDGAHPDGERIIRAAGKVRARFNDQESNTVSLEQVQAIKSEIQASEVSEVGVVLPETAGGEPLRGFLLDILATVGGVPHPSGRNGVSASKLEAFVSQAQAYLAWEERGRLPVAGEATETMPLAEATGPAYAALQAVRAKLDQFFAQCEAMVLDERFVQRMGWQEAELAGLDFDDPEVIKDVLVKAPVARANAERTLDFQGPVNPHYAKALDDFQRRVVQPVLHTGETTLTSLQWQKIKDFFIGHQQWLEARSGDAVAKLGIDRLRAYGAGDHVEAVRQLIAESSRTTIMLDGIRLVEKAILFQHLMIDFANNFVSFPHLYDTASSAMFEMGSLVMDGRRFNMAVRVGDRAQHGTVAQTSGMFTMYVELTGTPGMPPVEVAIPVTSGGKGNLCIGKRGLFFDVEGAEYNARVVQIIDNPISFIEAISAPFKKFGRMLTGRIESWTAESDKKFEVQAASVLNTPAGSAPPEPTAAAPPRAGLAGGGMGMVMGTGVAVAALGSAAAYITKTLSEISWSGLVLGILGALLIVLIPLSVIAILKLRKRDLSAILEGSGWAINARMRLTWRQGRFFTMRPPYPRGAKGVRRLLLRRILCLILLILTVALVVQHGNRLAKTRSERMEPAPLETQPQSPDQI